MDSNFSLIHVVNWESGLLEPDKDAKDNFVMVVIGNSRTEFAIYDLGYSKRIPIIVSSNVSLELLGQEYVPTPLKGDWVTFAISPLLNFSYPNRDCFLTLKSPPLLSPEPSGGPTGQIVLTVRRPMYRGDVHVTQEALNIHAQDIHSSYFRKNYSEIIMSVAKIINASNTYAVFGETIRAIRSKDVARSRL